MTTRTKRRKRGNGSLKSAGYGRNDPKGWGGDPSRGAALGRSSIHSHDRDFSGRLKLRRVSLDRGGYDTNGTYFGTGAPIWWYADSDGLIDATVRAPTRAAAIAQIREKYPRAKFAAEGREKLASSHNAEILKSMARTVFVQEWASREDEKASRLGRRYKGPIRGGVDLMDVAPRRVPTAAKKWAKELAAKIVAANGGASLASLADRLGRGDEDFGYLAAMQAVGHGVGVWEYDRTIKIPSFDYYG